MHILKLIVAPALAAATLLACAKGEQANNPPADSTARNLTLASPESSSAVHDVPAPPEAAKKATEKATVKPPPPKAAATYTAAAGTFLDMAVGDTISSKISKPGETYAASVVDDIKDASGHVVIPAGSTVHGTIDAVKQAPNPNTPGTLTLSVSSVTIRGKDYPLEAHIDSLETVRQGRGVTKGDAAKVGVGAAAGAILGRIVGGNSRGTIIGGVVGGAAGAGVAAATKSSDIVLPKGAHVNATITKPFTVAAP